MLQKFKHNKLNLKYNVELVDGYFAPYLVLLFHSSLYKYIFYRYGI